MTAPLRCSWAACTNNAVKWEGGYPHCADCLILHRRFEAEKTSPPEAETVATLHASGMTDREIAAYLERALSTIREQRRQLGLTPNKGVPEHGSSAAYKAHSRAKTPLCDACKAWSAAVRESRKVRRCGTHAAFNRHNTNGENPCLPCVKAERRYNTDMRRKSAAARAAA